MSEIERYPKPYREGILKISSETGADYETCLAMILMTAMLMDLHPGDKEVSEMILQDFKRETAACGAK